MAFIFTEAMTFNVASLETSFTTSAIKRTVNFPFKHILICSGRHWRSVSNRSYSENCELTKVDSVNMGLWSSRDTDLQRRLVVHIFKQSLHFWVQKQGIKLCYTFISNQLFEYIITFRNSALPKNNEEEIVNSVKDPEKKVELKNT